MILAVNSGSSSVRLALFDGQSAQKRDRTEGNLASAERLRAFCGSPDVVPDMVVHRIVHGGPELQAATEVTASVEQKLHDLVPLAPLHQPVGLSWLRAAREAFPRARQMAVFDTAFFTALPEVAKSYALPARLGARRFGFHGLAHQAMWRNVRADLNSVKIGEASGASRGDSEAAVPPKMPVSIARVITLQLGSGCSAAAILDGRPLDTSMGMTPLEGLVMATRPGDLDPGVARGLDEDLLNHQAGLLGLSGESGDLRVLLASSSEGARRAIELYCYRIKKYIGSYLAVLGGLDALVFGGGVGEHQPPIRAAALAGLEPFGIRLDDAKNHAAIGQRARIDAGGSVAVWVMPSDEEQQMVDAVLSP
jgi:acetate kinase